MAPDRAAAWACNCLWSGGGGDRDGRSTSGRWTNTGRRAVQTWSAACEVGCRHHPSPGSGETSPAGTKAMSGLPSGIQVRSSGPQREQSSSSSDDNGLERRTCRPSPRAARPGGRSPPYELAILASSGFAVAAVGPMVSRSRKLQGGSRARSAAAGAPPDRPRAPHLPGRHRWAGSPRRDLLKPTT